MAENTLPRIAQPDNSGQVKVAVTLDVSIQGSKYEMLSLSPEVKLVDVISDLCTTWNIGNAEQYQLLFDAVRMKVPPMYIDEDNRNLMQNGDVLVLDYSPSEMSRRLVSCLQRDDIGDSHADKLAKLSKDPLFSKEFDSQKGFDQLCEHIQRMARTSGPRQSLHGTVLAALLDLMEHNIKTWNDIDAAFIKSVKTFLEERQGLNPDSKLIKSSLVIIESAINASANGAQFVRDLELDVAFFFHTIKVQDPEIQSRCISLVNTVLDVSPPTQKKTIRKYLLSAASRKAIKERVFTMPIQDDMAYQLYALQTRLFNLLEERLLGAISPRDPAAEEELRALWRLAFESDADSTHRRNNDFSKLGFKDSKEPLQDFSEVPPGALALDCISHFANTYSNQYTQVVLENSRERADDQDCPFVQASIELTKLLADILHIGKEPGDDLPHDQTYYPMLFSKEKPFEEFFCVCIQRLTKTWKEMKASTSDFNKVLMVVREQITKSIADGPHTFDSFRLKLNQWNFTKIQEARQKEIDAWEERKTQAKPIRQLREMITPEILDVIKQQRINHMKAGHHFKKRAKKSEYLYCRLSHNTKVLLHATVSDQNTVPDHLQAVNILDIMEVKEERGRANEAVIKITLQESPDGICLNTSDPRVHSIWLDGLNALTGKPMTSQQAQDDLQELLSMDVKLRLLDAEGLNFPEEAPPIPPLPPNFNFVTA